MNVLDRIAEALNGSGGASAGGVGLPSPASQNLKEQEFIDNVDVLIRLLRLLVNRQPNILTQAQLGSARMSLSELERLMAQSGAKPASKPLPVSANITAIGIVGVVVVFAIVIVALSQDPTWRKHAKVMGQGAVEAVTGRARRLQQLMQEAQEGTVRIVAEGVVRINQRAYEITKSQNRCQDRFRDLEAAATRLTYDLYHRPSVVAASARVFLDAFVALLLCLGSAGLPLLRMLQEGWQDGLSLADRLRRLMGENIALPLGLGR
jgi:hypothetical protein